MAHLFDLMFRDPFSFLSGLALIAILLYFLYKMFNRFLRHHSLMKHGYPPPHCDADGDFVEEVEEKEDEK